MSWLPTIGKVNATGTLAEIYARIPKLPLPRVYFPPDGEIPAMIRAHSVDPQLIPLVFGGVAASLFTDETLSWARREIVNTATSYANQCFY